MIWIFLLLFPLLFPNTINAQEPATQSATVEIATPSAIPSVIPTAIPIPTVNPITTLFLQHQNDYLYQRDQYQQSLLNYTQKKQVHTKYNTVTTQKDKIESTQQALIARNSTLKLYLQALRVKLDLYKEADPTNTNRLQIEISKLESWLDEQNTIVSTFNNDTDIKSHATAFKQKFVFCQQIIYASIVQSEYNMRLLTVNQLTSSIQELLNDPTISPEGKQWVNGLTIKIDNAKVNLASSLEIINQEDNSLNNEFSNFYPGSKSKLVTASQYCNDIINDIKNIIIRFSI